MGAVMEGKMIGKGDDRLLTPDEQEELRQKDAAESQRDGLRADVMGSIAGSDPSSPGYLGRINHLVTAHGAVDALQPERMGPAGFDVRTMTPARTNQSTPNEATPDVSAGAPALMGSNNRMTPATPTALPPEGRAEMAGPPRMGAPAKPGILGRIGDVARTMGRIGARAGEIAGDVFAPGEMMLIPGTNLNRMMRDKSSLMRQEKQLDIDERRQRLESGAAQREFATPDRRRVYMEQHPGQFQHLSEFEKNDFILTGKFPQREPAAPKEADKRIDSYTNADGKRVEVLQKADGSTYEQVGGKTLEKPTHTSAFEAFTYGTPEEKKAAQDFLDLEKRLGSRYRDPTEFEEKYRLFQEDPETYKAMFGDKSGSGPDKATATKMLNYFDKRRREVQQDFTLEDQQKQEQLNEIDKLAQPFMDAVQPGAAGGPGSATPRPTSARGGSQGHRVTVIAPDGTRGTVPLSKLKAAKEQGYRVAAQ